MRPPPDPRKTAPTPDLAADTMDAIDLFRERLGLPATRPGTPLGKHDSALPVALGRGVFDCLDVWAAGLMPRGLSVDATRELYADVGRRFAEYVLPGPAEVDVMDAAAVSLFDDALRAGPDAGLLAAAFGAARLEVFRSDRSLVYRVRSYRGRAGLPLADHLLAAVVRPAVAAYPVAAAPDG